MNSTFDDFRETMHKLSWISHKRPEILAGVNILFEVELENYKPDEIKIINKLMEHVRANPCDGLTFLKLEIETIKIMVYSDKSFNSNNDVTSQVGYQICIV